MRSMLFMVLALWVLRESRAYGKQGMGEQEILLLDVTDRREVTSMSFQEVSDATVPNKPTQHVALMSSHDSRSAPKGLMPPGIADGTATNKHSLRLLLDRDSVRTLSHDTEREGQGQTFSFGQTAADKKVNVAQYVVGRILLHGNNVPVWLHEERQWDQEVVERTSADKQESARQHSNVHMSSHNTHVVRMSSDAVILGAEVHISQLDVIAETDGVREANAVRRQGVDSNLFKYAGLALADDSQTGVIDDVNLPPSLAGIQAQATRLIPATFKQAGLSFNEFTLPRNASFDPMSALVTMVYLKISSFLVYTLPPQYEFGGPVVGIISFSSNSTSADSSPPQESISLLPNTFINISLPMFSSNPTPNALCAFLASNGSIFVSNLASLPNICLASTLGYFALVVQASSTPSPVQNPPPPVAAASPSTNANVPSSSSTTSKPTKNWKLIVGATCLALGGLAFLIALALISIKLADSFKLFFTTRFTGNEEALQNALIGNSKAPTAAVMRTKPALEIDIAHFSNSLVA